MDQYPNQLRSLIAEAHRTSVQGTGTPSLPFGTIGELLRRQADARRDQEWLIFYPDRPDGVVRFRYGDFFTLVGRVSNLLLRLGIGRGDMVATIAFNHSDTVIQYFAAWMMGAVVVPINVGEDDRRIEFILRDSGTRCTFIREEYFDRTEPICRRASSGMHIILVGNSDTGGRRRSPSLIDFHTAIHRQSESTVPDSSVGPDDEALIVYTSGTTGNPKGVVLTHRNLLIDAAAISEWHRLTSGGRLMCILPIHHVNGIIVTLITPLFYGGSVVLNQKFHTGVFFRRLAAENVQIVSVVPTILQFLLHENPDIPPGDLNRLRHFICGAGPLTCELAGQFEDRFGIPVIHGYGLSETTCYSSFLPLDLSPDEHRRWLTGFGFPSIGVPVPPNEMEIHDLFGNSLGEGQRGEIVIRGANVMKHYLADTGTNIRAFAKGWFHSGDEGFYKSDSGGRRFFFITGRLKELIIRGGVNISPFEIDEVLMKIPGVKAGLAVGFENDWYGEEVGAYVQLEEGITMTGEEILTRCRMVLPFSKAPKAVLFGNDIPVTSTGKYQRGKLRPLFAHLISVQFSPPPEST